MTECYAVLCYAILCYAMLYYAILCYTMLYYVTECYAVLCYAILCYAMLYYVTECNAVLCYAILCYVMLYYAILCDRMLCCTMLCYTMLQKRLNVLCTGPVNAMFTIDQDTSWSAATATSNYVYASFPVDVIVYFHMQPSTFRFSCLPVSRVECMLQLPSLDIVFSSKRAEEELHR